MKPKSIIESVVSKFENENNSDKKDPLVYAHNFGAYVETNKEEILKEYENQSFSIWKSALIKCVNELNKSIKSTFRFYPDLFSWGDTLSIKRVKRDNSGKLTYAPSKQIKLKDKIGFIHTSIYEDNMNLRYCKILFDALFPKSKIYIVAMGNLNRNTKYFKKNQKLRLLFHGNSGEGALHRSAWLGFNRKTKKYEAHNIYNKFFVNIRYKLVGSIPNHSAALYY